MFHPLNPARLQGVDELAFDPEAAALELSSDASSAQACLGIDLQYAKSVCGLGNAAETFVSSAVRCYLCGLGEQAVSLLVKAVSWVKLAIKTSERPQAYFPEYPEATRFETLALCNWLLCSQQDRASQEAFVRHADTYLRRVRGKLEVGAMVKGYVDAEAYDPCLSITE